MAKKGLLRTLIKQRYLIMMILPATAVLIIFNYLPMYGVLVAFKNYKFGGIMSAPWVGFEWFEEFIHSPYFFRILKNTLLIGFYSLLWGFPAPILFAMLLNELGNEKFKKLTQTISYLPHFVSTIIVIGMLKQFCSTEGLFNSVRVWLGFNTINFFAESSCFRTLFIGSGIWQMLGWNSIIYLAALTGVDPQLYEAATVEGANRLQKAMKITLPALMPTICILLILNVGSVLNLDYQKVLLMYNPSTYDTADIIGTYTYRVGIEDGRYSYTAAVGLFANIISCLFVIITNQASKKLSDNSLW